ncbi:intraflagellar transport protein 88 homolog isoform X1 [Entelurus aequoreus]|uniref:intraflagellar transport protein 88 homolog isoform X1 n=1 Tax=Entelurus aequoreus TaxID=161455 RepID=UPI002B1E766B|nr:intraflagellar transport protein 88 homolog isoform X1 [Entelurus aequoreus]XP_061923424.1 intraflagellar transport protein 88 homolog isoform X1 [Entelurus aequoreus]
MSNRHLPAEEDDLYSGYNDFNPLFDCKELENDVGFQEAIRSSHGRKPLMQPITGHLPDITTGGRPLSSSSGSRTPMLPISRPVTGAVQQSSVARPMSAISAAGYSSSPTRSLAFDPLGQSRGPAPPLEEKKDDAYVEKIKMLEKKVNDLTTESCMAQSVGNSQLALEKAKEAERKERALVRQREQSDSAEQTNIDRTYAVLLNLANQYENNEMYPEALSSYQLIVKNKMFTNEGELKGCSPGRLKVNLANIFVKQKNYPKAIKFYRMALDHISDDYKEMRIKIMQNIGTVFVLLGQYPDAITSFEHIMSESPNIRTGYNLILCYYASRDGDGMKIAFQKLLSVPLGIDDEDKYISANDDIKSNMLIEAIKDDKLHQMERELKARAEKYVMTAAKLIAPAIESSFAAGFDWCVDLVKSSPYVELANDLQLKKAMTFFRQMHFDQAMKILKEVAKQDSRVKSAASNNLCSLYILEKDYEQAERYADLAMNADRYNPGAFVCKGNTEFVKQDYVKAAEFFKEALRNDSSCTEALRNLGLTYKKLNRLEDALDCFLKLHAILRDSAEVMYQLADTYELLEDPQQAVEWLMQVISVVPNDPKALAKLGDLHDLDGDKSQALHYYCESFRLFPCNMGVIEWLAAYYVQTQLYEKAIQYFERAILVQPSEVRWQLLVASCYRRSGNNQKALETYKEIHRRFPEDAQCLRFLVRISQDLGLKEVQDYTTKLSKVEKMKELREQRVKAAREGSRSRRAADNADTTDCSKSERPGAHVMSLPVSGEPYESSSPKELDASYVDPLGPPADTPRTGARKRADDDVFAGEDVGDQLLPE